ncbi:hypothetical protein [uncultured Hymenobacter sp.]|uniref:hypothetical protein n=1 Tax=uncultured Hymenobacter sp. TaxID=170016 RepID=UPI0035CA5DD1
MLFRARPTLACFRDEARTSSCGSSITDYGSGNWALASISFTRRCAAVDSSLLQKFDFAYFDFAYKDSAALPDTQPYLVRCDETQPIVTVKFTGV